MSFRESLPVAVQLYSLRELPGSFDETLSQVSKVGFTAVETVYRTDLPASEMLDLLEKHRLRVISAHVPLGVVEEDLDAVISFNQYIGNSVLVVPALPQELREGKTVEEWQAVGRRLNEIGRRCREAGFLFGYHNHAFEMPVIEGRHALDWLLQSAKQENLFWEPDLAWIVAGGADPLALLERYVGRCPRVHVKDRAPEGQNEEEGGWADVGYGMLDWDTLLPAAKRAGAEWYIVEHDKPSQPVESIRRSLEFLRSKVELL
jgi:sugar phosphate isomerase/epimerase